MDGSIATPVDIAQQRKELKAAKVKAYRAAHPEEVHAKDAANRAKRADKIKVYQAAYQAAHSEEIKAKRAVYFEAKFEEHRARKAAYYAANADKQNEPKRRAHFEDIERQRQKNSEEKGIPFYPRTYVVLTTKTLTDEQYIELYRRPRPVVLGQAVSAS